MEPYVASGDVGEGPIGRTGAARAMPARMSDPFHFRVAAASDVDALIDLMMVSSWGGIRAAWERVKGPRESWRQRGRAEIGDETCEIGYARFILAEEGGRIAGMILLNLLGATGSLDPAAEPPEQAGAVALIKRADHSAFVRELAVADWARGRGLARRLLDVAADVAASKGFARVTLIVNDANGPAHGLYRASGFRQIGMEPSIGHPAFPDGSMLLLMERSVGGG